MARPQPQRRRQRWLQRGWAAPTATRVAALLFAAVLCAAPGPSGSVSAPQLQPHDSPDEAAGERARRRLPYELSSSTPVTTTTTPPLPPPPPAQTTGAGQGGSVPAAPRSGATATFDVFALFDRFDSSAIQMQGSSYYVNYNTLKGTLRNVAIRCYEERDCISFDFDGTDTSPGTGWFHRVGRECASEAGGTFRDGDSSGSVFLEIKPSVRAPNATDRCPATAAVPKDPGFNSGRLAAAVFGTVLATLTGSALLTMAVLALMRIYIARRGGGRRRQFGRGGPRPRPLIPGENVPLRGNDGDVELVPLQNARAPGQQPPPPAEED